MNSLDKFLLFVALPAVVVASLIEATVLARKQSYDWRASAVSFFDLVARVGIQIFLPLSIATPLIVLAFRHRLATIPLDGVTALVALFIGQEFCYYWFHRAAHRVRWFWCNHAVHHSPNELNLSAAYRIGMLSRLTGSSVFYVPLVWFGFPPKVVFEVLSLNLLYQFWIHATWIPKLGWLEWVLNTPSAHRVHHAANLEYLDANYGGVLIVFDRLFGTYRAERDDVPCRYGLVTPLRSYNPLKIEFHQWAGLARDLARARSPRAVLGHLLMPPGWVPQGEGQTTEDLRRRAAMDGVPTGGTVRTAPTGTTPAVNT
jgi:sterol desaturase/sphingolipid hydroxylase (fatty acid hydroxylase superfamily)